jgi:anti-anti-sigma factor
MPQTHQPEEKTRIEFEGSLDTAKCQEIETDVHAAIDNADQEIEFDLAKVDFVSSSFLRLCIQAQRKAGVDGFRIINVNPSSTSIRPSSGSSRSPAWT